MSDHRCVQCGTTLDDVTYNQRFCSTRCHDAWWGEDRRRERPEVVCARCGTVFEGTRVDARYCSVTCRVAAHRARRREN